MQYRAEGDGCVEDFYKEEAESPSEVGAGISGISIVVSFIDEKKTQ